MIKKVKLSGWLLIVLFLLGLNVESTAAQYSALSENDNDKNNSFSTHIQQLINESQTNKILLVDIGLPENATLDGPYEEVKIDFNFPPDWETINGHRIESISLNQTGDALLNIKIRPEYLNIDHQSNQLLISWDAVEICRYNGFSSITLKPSSSLIISKISKTILPNLNNFPSPFFAENDMSTNTTAFVIPEAPLEDELSALVSAAAGFGKLSEGKIPFEIIKLDQLNQNRYRNDNFIIIGIYNSLKSFLSDLGMDNEIEEILKLADQGSGLISLHVSPWNPGRAMMLITGEDSDAVHKASAALGSENMIIYSGNQYAIIKDITEKQTDSQFQTDYLLDALFQESMITTEQIGESEISASFSIPHDAAISPESYIELYFRHSQLLNYLQSSLAVSINGTPIGNLRFSDQSSENGLERIILPPNIIKPSKNILELSFSLAPQDICADMRTGNYWLTILGESYLHLPLTIGSSASEKIYYLDQFPYPFINDEQFGDLVFVVEKDNIETWKHAANLAFLFGTYTNSNALTPSVIYTESYTSDVFDRSYIFIGTTESIPHAADINKYLPLPFDSTGRMKEIPSTGVVFEIDQTQDLGFLELIRFPETDKYNLAILGNSSEGLSSAIQLINEKAKSPFINTSNIEIIDSQNNNFSFNIEKEIDLKDQKEKDVGALERIFLNNSDKISTILLIIIILLIIVFSFWTFKPRKKKDIPKNTRKNIK